MNIEELYKKLIKAFSNNNLNKITRKLISLYKNKNFGKIREIASIISKEVQIDEEKDAKCFSKLIMLYHPDKGEQIRETIHTHFEQNDIENLAKYSHILLLPDIDNICVTTVDDDIDYNPEYTWDANQKEGYSFSDNEFDSSSEENIEDDLNSDDYEKSFYNAIKIREYGNIEIEFPPYYLEDIEEFEMTHSGPESLEGVEYCVHVKTLDISNNVLSDITKLRDLESLEELYLANNQIGYIDTLSNLINLRVLDLSGNQIDDISPIFDLENLEYINLIGNPVPEIQIEQLKEKGVLVM
ncbi:MAG: hypothetical protein GY756_18995 [bacterium]|nr:hypothetical protein [bacterium]